jgi:hypothetical protein
LISAPQLQSALQKVSDLIEAADHSLRLEVDYFGNSRTEENREIIAAALRISPGDHPDDRTRNPGRVFGHRYSVTSFYRLSGGAGPASDGTGSGRTAEIPAGPEVSALLHYVPDLHRKMLLATLWNTGARINEALALTRSDFSLAPPYPFVQLASNKGLKKPPERLAVRPSAVRLTGWYRFLMRTMSVNWR